jgi:urease accessory protein
MSAVTLLSEAPAADGEVRASVGAGGAFGDIYQRQPLRLLRPRVDAGEPQTGILVNTAGGIVGGDRHRIDIDCVAGGAALLIGQAAEKVYRSSGATAVVDVTLTARRDSRLEWLPQGTILFDAAKLKRQTTVRREPGARVLAGEILVLGRLGMNESVRTGSLFDRWRIEDCGELAWLDALHLDGDIARLAAAKAGLDGARSLATAIYLADDAADRLDEARALLPESTSDLRAGATVLGPLLICRWLGREPHRLREAVGNFWRHFRASALGRTATLPTLWHH